MKGLRLSAAECSRLETSLHVLLSSLEYETMDAWRLASNRAVRLLLDGDMATFQMGQSKDTPMLSEEVDTATLHRYPAHLQDWNRKLGMVKRMTSLGVWTREVAWGSDIGLLYASEYWNDLMVPARAIHAIGATVQLDEAAHPVTLYVNRDHPHGTFRDRDAALLRLVFPAFRAGLLARLRLDAVIPRLGALCDAVADAMQICDSSGRVVHRNRAATIMLGADPEHAKLEQVLAELVIDLVGRGAPGVALVARTGGVRAVREVATEAGRYEFSGCLVTEMLPSPGVLVLLRRSAERMPSVESLANFRGFTRRHAQVALLLAKRASNAEVAAQLGISEHTARHHTERVLAKLGVSSRLDVRAELLKLSALLDQGGPVPGD